MSLESIVSLSPIDGGDPISIPCEKTVIGRGSLLQITDKRVSRNHATLEVCDGKLVIVPIHTNPCFYKPNDSKASVVLQKDKPKTLLHGDVISLLPDKLLYKIVYRNNPEKNTESEVSPKESNEAEEMEEDTTTKEDAAIVPEKKDLNLQPEKPSTEVAKKDEKESNNGRHLPDWMVGAASRLKLKDASSKVKNGQSSTTATTQNKTPKPKAGTQHKAKKLDYCDDEEEDDKDDESDAKNVDDDEDEDDDDERWSSKKSSKRKSSPPRSKTTRKTSSRRRHSDDDDEDDVGGKRRKRMPRAATQKAPKYTDDDFVMSDEEFVIEEDESEQSKGEDSDFVMDDADSGSDWDNKGKSKQGRGRSGKGRSSSRVRRGKYDSDEISEEDDDDYKPRSTKKRNTSTRKRKRRDSEDDDDDNDDDDDDYRGSRRKAAKRKHTPKTKKRNTGGKKRRRSEEEEEDENGFDEEEEEEKPTPKKVTPKNKRKKINDDEEEGEEEVEGDEKSAKSKKVPCQFGVECYRKNPKHLEDFTHPSEKGKTDEAEDLNAPRQKRAAALKQKEKLEAMHEASEDDEEMQEELTA